MIRSLEGNCNARVNPLQAFGKTYDSKKFSKSVTAKDTKEMLCGLTMPVN